MANTASLKQEYKEQIAPALMKQFGYSSAMQIPVLKKIVINQGLGMATADKKIIEVAVNEITAITGQKAVATVSKKDVAQFKLRKKMPIGVMVTLRRERMYEFLEKLVKVALPRIREQVRRPRQLHPGYRGADYLPRNQHRCYRPHPGYEHHLRDHRQDGRRGLCPVEGFWSSF